MAYHNGMQAGDFIRIECEIHASLLAPDVLMQMGREAVQSTLLEQDWEENYPQDLHDAIAEIVENALMNALQQKGVLVVQDSSVSAKTVIPEDYQRKSHEREVRAAGL